MFLDEWGTPVYVRPKYFSTSIFYILVPLRWSTGKSGKFLSQKVIYETRIRIKSNIVRTGT